MQQFTRMKIVCGNFTPRKNWPKKKKKDTFYNFQRPQTAKVTEEYKQMSQSGQWLKKGVKYLNCLPHQFFGFYGLF